MRRGISFGVESNPDGAMVGKVYRFDAPLGAGQTAQVDPVDAEAELVVGRFGTVHGGGKTMLGQHVVERSMLVLCLRNEQHVPDPKHRVGVEVAANNGRT